MSGDSKRILDDVSDTSGDVCIIPGKALGKSCLVGVESVLPNSISSDVSNSGDTSTAKEASGNDFEMSVSMPVVLA